MIKLLKNFENIQRNDALPIGENNSTDSGLLIRIRRGQKEVAQYTSITETKNHQSRILYQQKIPFIV